MENYAIRTEKLVKRYKNKIVLNEVSINVKQGEIYGLIGKNGAGKTTLMKLILGIAKSDSGKIFINESENLSAQRKNIGSLIESPGLYKGSSAKENLEFFATLYGAEKGEVEKLLKLVGLENTGRKSVGKFSLGMKQRLGIAISLLANPKILVLDEPINGLDPSGIKEIRNLLLDLNKEKNVTILISSHIIDELAKIVDTYGIINNGILVEEISKNELEKKCGNTIKVVCEDNQKAYDFISENFKDIKAELKEDGIYIQTKDEILSTINSELVKNGFAVKEITKSTINIEDFFIERMEAK